MFDLPGFWRGWVITLTLVGLAWIGWLMYAVYFRRPQDQAAADAEIEKMVWDEDLREGVAPPPIWWFWFLLATLVFSLIYLILYPGLGNLKGALDWTQAKQLQASVERDIAQYGDLRAGWESAALSELAADETAMRVAGRLYQNNCAACHGVDAKGQANLFPDLTDDDWQWGDSEADLLTTLRNGRIGVMPGWEAVLGVEGSREVAEYVLALSSGQADAPVHAEGKQQYLQVCAACHAPDGSGNPLLGAPDLTDDIWLYGGSLEAVLSAIATGLNGQMPAQQGRLTEAQMRLLVAWLKDGARALPAEW